MASNAVGKAELIKERNFAVKLIERLDAKCQSAEAKGWNEAVIDMQRSALERHWALFQNKQLAIAEMASISEGCRSRNETASIDMANLYYNCKQRLSTLISVANPNRNRPLPKASEIMLPKFNGNYTAWTAWRTQFASKVLETELTPGSKIDLLLTALVGEARRCAGEAEHRDQDELTRIWEKLTHTYDNPYQIVTAHINVLIDLPTMEFGRSDTLRHIIDTVEQELRSLDRFNCDTDAWSPFMAVYVLRKLDRATRAAWEMDRDPVAAPSLKDLLPFLERRIFAMRNLATNNSAYGGRDTPRPVATDFRNKRRAGTPEEHPAKRKIVDAAAHTKQLFKPVGGSKGEDSCAHCKGYHRVWHCKKLADLEFSLRVARINELTLCECCLSNRHPTSACTWKGCKACNNAKHNRIICPKFSIMRVNLTRPGRFNGSISRRQNQHQVNVVAQRPTDVVMSKGIVSDHGPSHDEGLPVIGTAMCQLRQTATTISGDIRTLCDSGSQLNLITQDCVQRWGLARKPCKVAIAGVGDEAPIPSLGMIECVLCNRRDPAVCMTVRFVIVAKISGKTPQRAFSCPLLDQLDNEELADPAFAVPGPVEALIGVATWTSIIYDDILRSLSTGDRFIAQNSMLGWVISGYAKRPLPRQPLSLHISKASSQLDKQLELFWSVNDGEDQTALTPDEQRAEDIFASTHTRDQDGRYIVRIPFREDVIALGQSRQVAFNRYIGLENRLRKNASMYSAYKEFMLDYLKEGHLIPAPPAPEEPSMSYYIPHHIICKKKFRVVFDASCLTSSGVSLNDLQLPGAKLQADLYETLLLFRTYRFALTADIVKMFRQIKVHSDHWNFQRIFFRPEADQPVGEYFLTRVIWGFTSAGFNSVRALQQCARDEAVRFPVASAATLVNFYIDDLLSGAETAEELAIIYAEMTEMLKAGGFQLSKWATSNPEFAKALSHHESRQIELRSEAGVLGMNWDPVSDNLQIKIHDYPEEDYKPVTKRQIISRIAQVYDPTGLYAPVMVAGKIVIQEVWKLKLDWDDIVPDNIKELWLSFYHSVIELAGIPVPRWIGCSKKATIQIHLFSDASKLAYGTCAYLRASHADGRVTVRLITSRNKVAPVKTQTIPRLELMGAVMSADLCKFIQKACKLPDVATWYWTDSTIVLHWLKKNLRALKPFVANRVNSVLASSTITDWHHIRGDQNPADILSRGCVSSQLKDHHLWWNGPPWLSRGGEDWPNEPQLNLTKDDQDADEAESTAIRLCAHAHAVQNNSVPVLSVGGEPLVERASTLKKLLCTTAYVFRFVKRTKQPTRRLAKHPASFQDVAVVSPPERDCAISYWARQSQTQHYAGECKALRENKEIPAKSKLLQLCPFMDEKGVLRVGGRLGKSSLPFAVKHQIIVHPKSSFGKLVIADAHARSMHGGAQLTLAVIRQRYWIPNGRVEVKKSINSCVICVRFKKDMAQQLMGSLPPVRTNQAFPFSAAGVDFAGPFEIRKTLATQMNLRQMAKNTYKTPPTVKCWVVVFVCMVTRAVHLDLAHGLSVEAFLEVFTRFISCRGHCSRLHSDNGTNFVGANKELQRVRQEWQNKLPVQELANLGTTWQFNSPAAPHQGGLWEACVKSMKYHLRRVVGRRILSANQLYTVLTQIECCLNSRPLAPLSDDHDDFEFLTPGHFLTGRSLLHQPPSEDVTQTNDNRLTLWGQQQKLTQACWVRWKEDFLLAMQKRTKWYRPRENLKPGDMVLVMDENRPPAVWPIGRVEAVYPGKDGLVRNVTVRTATGSKDRPIQKLCILPINGQEAQVQTPLTPQ